MTVTGDRRLPDIAVVLLAIAAAILWLLSLLLIFGIALTTYGNVEDLFPAWGVMDSDPALGTALMFQMGATGLALLLSWVMSTWIVATHLMGKTAEAVSRAVILVRVFMGLAVLSFLAGLAVPVAMSPITALPSVAAALPQLLIQLALLFCADRYLTRRPVAEVF